MSFSYGDCSFIIYASLPTPFLSCLNGGFFALAPSVLMCCCFVISRPRSILININTKWTVDK